MSIKALMHTLVFKYLSSDCVIVDVLPCISGADVDRYFTTLEVTEADSNCDPDKVVSTVRKMVVLNQDDSTSKSAVNMLESALKINPHAEVL